MTFSPNITNNTLVDYPRLEEIRQCLIDTEHTPGVVAEVGVYKGGTAFLICGLTSQFKKSVLLFDTFCGMPEVDKQKDLHKTGDFQDTSAEAVSSLLSEYNNFIIQQGLFPQDTAKPFENCIFSFVHLDCDIYLSVYNSLAWFYPRMSKGGIIVLDDYNEPNCPGAKTAADLYMSDKSNIILPTCQSQAIIRL